MPLCLSLFKAGKLSVKPIDNQSDEEINTVVNALIKTVGADPGPLELEGISKLLEVKPVASG
jgi:hypothetical protein